jgi:cytohesin
MSEEGKKEQGQGEEDGQVVEETPAGNEEQDQEQNSLGLNRIDEEALPTDPATNNDPPPISPKEMTANNSESISKKDDQLQDTSEDTTTSPGTNSYAVNRLEDLILYNDDELQHINHEAVIKFNMKPKSARQYLITKRVIQGLPSEMAEFIQKNSKISKRRVGEYIGNYEPFNQLVCEELFSRYDLKNKTLDMALRLLLLQFRLPGEAQQIDRILEKFSTHFHLQNPGVFLNSDTAYVLSFSLIMLNTDLHNQSIVPEKKMTIDQFVKNNRGINAGQDIPRELLVTLYHSVKENEIRMEETDMYESEVIAFMAPTKSGWLTKQTENLLEFGMWKRYWFVLNDGCLYYFTDPSDEGPTCIIPLDNTKPGKGKSDLEVILTSSVSGDHIKSSKVLEDGRMEQGRHTQLIFRFSLCLSLSVSHPPLFTQMREYRREGCLGEGLARGVSAIQTSP